MSLKDEEGAISASQPCDHAAQSCCRVSPGIARILQQRSIQGMIDFRRILRIPFKLEQGGIPSEQETIVALRREGLS